MNYTVVILLVVVVLAVLAFFWWGKKPHKHRNIAQDQLEEFLEALFYRGYDGGFICIEIPKSRSFIQFSKYMGTRGVVGLQFDFPLADWSKEYYAKLSSVLNDRAVKYEIQSTGEAGVSEFLVVDLKQDVKMASYLAKLVIQDVFDLGKDDCVDLYFENVSPRNEKIGFRREDRDRC